MILNFTHASIAKKRPKRSKWKISLENNTQSLDENKEKSFLKENKVVTVVNTMSYSAYPFLYSVVSSEPVIVGMCHTVDATTDF